MDRTEAIRRAAEDAARAAAEAAAAQAASQLRPPVPRPAAEPAPAAASPAPAEPPAPAPAPPAPGWLAQLGDHAALGVVRAGEFAAVPLDLAAIQLEARGQAELAAGVRRVDAALEGLHAAAGDALRRLVIGLDGFARNATETQTLDSRASRPPHSP